MSYESASAFADLIAQRAKLLQGVAAGVLVWRNIELPEHPVVYEHELRETRP